MRKYLPKSKNTPLAHVRVREATVRRIGASAIVADESLTSDERNRL